MQLTGGWWYRRMVVVVQYSRATAATKLSHWMQHRKLVLHICRCATVATKSSQNMQLDRGWWYRLMVVVVQYSHDLRGVAWLAKVQPLSAAQLLLLPFYNLL